VRKKGREREREGEGAWEEKKMKDLSISGRKAEVCNSIRVKGSPKGRGGGIILEVGKL